MSLPIPADGSRFVSTGALPDPELVAEFVTDAHHRFRDVHDGTVSAVYPAPAAVPGDIFGVAVAATSGRVFTAGEPHRCQRHRPAVLLARRRRAQPRRRTNPMVNAGALVATSLLPGRDLEDRWALLRDGLSRFAGRELALGRGRPPRRRGDEPPQPGHRAAAARCGSPGRRSGRDGGAVHPPELPWPSPRPTSR